MNVASIMSPPAASVDLTRPRAAAGPKTPAEERKQVGAQFEAILVRQLLNKTLTSMLGTEQSAASDVYGDMLTDSIAQKLSAGRGLGLGRMIEQQLTPRGTPAAHLPSPTQP